MPEREPRVLIVFVDRGSPNGTQFGGFARRLRKRGGLDGIVVDHVALDDLYFQIKGEDTSVTDLRTDAPIDGYDWVYFKSWERRPDVAAAFASYLQRRGIAFVDSAAAQKGFNKLASHMAFWARGIKVASTVHCARHQLLPLLPRLTLKYPLVIKDVNGQKGRLNFLVRDQAEAAAILEQHPGTEFLVQEYIPSTHDLRVQVFGGAAKLVIERTPRAGSHLNNSAAGATARLLPAEAVDPRVLDLAERAAEAVGLQIAGVDIMPHAGTGEYHVLEVNQGSQIATGSITNEKMDGFIAYLRTQAG